MSLSQEEQNLIRQSFNKVAPKSQEVAKKFYDRLWEIAPETKTYFKGSNMIEQGRKLMQTLAFVFAGLQNLESIKPVVKDLGKRHLSYGIQKEQYHSVGAALIWTLEQELGEGFTEEVKNAWLKVYTILVEAATSVYETKAEEPSNSPASSSRQLTQESPDEV